MKLRNRALIALIGSALISVAPLRADDTAESNFKQKTANFFKRAGTAGYGFCKLTFAAIGGIGGTLLLFNKTGGYDKDGNLLKNLSAEEKEAFNFKLRLAIGTLPALWWGAIKMGQSGINTMKSAFQSKQ